MLVAREGARGLNSRADGESGFQKKPAKITMAEKLDAPSQLVATTDEISTDVLRAEHKAEIRAARSAGQRWRRISRWMGLAIFALGAGLLAYVFRQAFVGFGQLANSGYLSSQFNSRAGDDLTSVLVAALAVFGQELLKVLYLLILGFLASAIAARGIQFFAASEAVIDEAVVPDDVS